MAGPGPDSAGIQRQGAKLPRRNRIFLLRNQETKNHRKDFMVSWLPNGIVFGRAFAPWPSETEAAFFCKGSAGDSPDATFSSDRA
jgi:hypothetical protein